MRQAPLLSEAHHLVALIETRIIVVAPVEGDVALACLVVKGGEGGRRGPGRRQAAARQHRIPDPFQLGHVEAPPATPY